MKQTIEQAFEAAVKNPENWDEKGIIWNYIDADTYMDSAAKRGTNENYSERFDELADSFVGLHGVDVKYDQFAGVKV